MGVDNEVQTTHPREELIDILFSFSLFESRVVVRGTERDVC